MAEAPAFQFNNELVNLIRLSRNTEAKSMLNEELAKASDGKENLLHLAVYHNNIEIVEHLMELGCDINFRGQTTGKTALIIAVENERLASIEILLNAGADIDLVDNEGMSALKMVVKSDYFNTEIVLAFLEKLRDQYRENQDLVEKLLSIDAALHHVMLLGDLNLVSGILRHRETWETRLVENESQLANRDVRDVVEQEKVAIFVRLVSLSRQVEGTNKIRSSSMNLLFTNGFDTRFNVQFNEFASAVGRRYAGTIHRGSGFCCFKILDDRKYERFTRMIYDLIAYIAMMEKNGTPCVSLAICQIARSSTEKIAEVESYHNTCDRMLDTIMYDNLTLFVLVTDRHDNMRILVRDQTFERMIREACVLHQLNEQSFAYYYNTLMSRIQKANNLVNMENSAIDIAISNIFENDHSQFYNLARRMIGYLSESDIERFCVAFL